MKPFVPVDYVLDRFERSSGRFQLRRNLAGRSGRAHDPRLRGRAHPDDLLRELRGHSESFDSPAAGSRSAESERVDRSSTLSNSIISKGKNSMNPIPQLSRSPDRLSNLMGAYDTGHWQTAVSEIKAGIGVLARGTVLATGTAGDIGKLVKMTAGTEAQAYGVLLDEAVDTGAAYSDGTSRARSRKRARFAEPRSSFRRASTQVSSRSRCAVAASSSKVRSPSPPLLLRSRGRAARRRGGASSSRRARALVASAESMARRRQQEDEARRRGQK